MAEYNPSKIIKDGNTYNFRDTTKIPLTGSNEISGSLIPSTDGTVDLGSPSYQWNNAYIKSLTINGVVCGDILTHNVSEFVDVSTVQTIGGRKVFSDSPRVKRTTPDIALDISDCDVTELPTEAKFASLFFRDKNTKNLAYITGQQRTDGTKRMCLRTHRTDNIDKYYSVNLDSDGNFYPEQNNAINLGTPALQYNNAYIKSLTINGVACGDILTYNASEFVGVTGAQTITGVKTFASNMVIQGGKKVTCNLDNSFIELDGGTTWGKGGSIVLSGQDRSSYTNSVLIVSKSDTNTDILQYQNGELKPHPNNTNNSSLGTSTSKWSKVYSDDVVHTTGNETIDGSKYFTSLLSKSSTLERGSLPTTTINEDPIFISADKNNRRTLAFFNYYYPNGDGRVVLYAYNQNTTDFDNIGLVFSFNNRADTKSIYPVITETYNLGTSTNKWKAVYSNAYYLGSTAFGDIVTYNAAEFVPRSGGAVMTGDLLASSTINSIGFGYGWGNGSTIYTYSPTHSTAEWQGTIRLEPLKTTSNFKTMQLAPDGTWTWSGTACQITSDQRYKQQITEIDDKLLDAWGDVELVQFKYNESVDTKGESARLHTGYVVQQIDSACKSHGVDISEYGLYCHEEYPEETKEVEIEQADGTKTKETKVIREASEHYSLRYTEALIVECKYLRRCIARLTTRIEELEKGNKEAEK